MCLFPRYIKFFDGKKHIIDYPLEGYISIPCGKCVECNDQYVRDWTIRAYHEYSKTNKGCVLTLTYNDEFLPSDGNLRRRDVQLYLKRLRKSISFRFYGCGEYGGKTFRPHYHIILFGYEPDDWYYWQKSRSGNDIYRSPFLEKEWSMGFVYVERFDLKAVKYCMKYLQKYAFEKCPELDAKIVKPFSMMSLRPGIGDLSQCSFETDKVYLGGKSYSLPRYYLKMFEKEGRDFTELRKFRDIRMRLFVRDKKSLEKLRKRIDRRYFM